MKQKHTGTAIKRTRGDVIFDVINVLLLLIVMLVVAYPLVYAISCSFSSPLRVVQSKVYLLPKGLTTIAYERVFNNQQILTGYKNTIFYTLLGTAINIVLTTMTAYPLSRRDFKARRFITFLFTFTMLFSGGLIPTFLVVRDLGLMNTVWALILPGAVSAYNMFILRNYMQSLPAELEESARIDGAHAFTILFRIILPLSTPSLAAIAMFYGVGNWNSYMDCLLYTNKPQLQVLQLYLRQVLLQTSSSNASMAVAGASAENYISDTAMQMVIIAVTVIPILIVYPWLQRFYTKGITVGAVKG